MERIHAHLEVLGSQVHVANSRRAKFLNFETSDRRSLRIMFSWAIRRAVLWRS